MDGLQEAMRTGLICAAYIGGAQLICGLIAWISYEPGDVAIEAGITCFLVELAAVGVASHSLSRTFTSTAFITLLLTLIFVTATYFVFAVVTGLLSPLTSVEAMFDASQSAAPLLLFSVLVGSVSGLLRRST